MTSSNNERHSRGIGVFLCQCGERIAPMLDLSRLKSLLDNSSSIDFVTILPFPCMTPGLTVIKEAVAQKGLDRIVVAGCESRVMLKKFERELYEEGLEQGQIDMVNLRDHVAGVFQGRPEELADKAAKLIKASVAGLTALKTSPKVKVGIKGPVMIVGGGAATYSAAQELLRQEIDTLIAVASDDIEDEIRMLHESYPGERDYHDRLREIMREVDESPYVKKISEGEPEKVLGRFGDYSVAFSSQNGGAPRVYQCGAVIAALDGEMLNQGSDFGHDGVRVVCHTEMEEQLWVHGVPEGRVVFWINDLESDQPWAQLSARTAWNLARYIRERTVRVRVSILYNTKMPLPLSAMERTQAGDLEIDWISYDSKIRPTVQAGYITYTRPVDQIEVELAWDKLVLSPRRSPGHEAVRLGKLLGLSVNGHQFLEKGRPLVRPEQVGQDEKFLAGSARRPCDLRDTLRQGRRVAKKVMELIETSQSGGLYAPRIVCTVDRSKCIGCGLCREICECGGIEPVEGPGGNIPREVDPMVCTGGGTCAAACPYHALSLQNNTTEQREARVSELVQCLAEDEVMGFGCNWGGGAAADHAGLKHLAYNPRFYLLPVGCIGQLDPIVMGRAFRDGANGLLVIGCPPEQCHHSYGLDHAWSRVNLVKKLLSLCGIERERIALAHADLNNPEQYVVTVESFMAMMDRLGPIERTDQVKEKLRGAYDTLRNSRVRWVLGAGLRRPYEQTYPADQRHALAFDETLSDVVAEEFIRSRVMALLRESGQVMDLEGITRVLEESNKQVVLNSLKELAQEGLISRIFKDRTPFYAMR